jgi:hypothetical protein
MENKETYHQPAMADWPRDFAVSLPTSFHPSPPRITDETNFTTSLVNNYTERAARPSTSDTVFEKIVMNGGIILTNKNETAT